MALPLAVNTVPDELESRMDELEQDLDQLTEFVILQAQYEAELETATNGQLEYLDSTLGTLIRMMDEWIRGNRPQ